MQKLKTPSNCVEPSKLIHVLLQMMFVRLGGPGGGWLAATRKFVLFGLANEVVSSDLDCSLRS